MQQINERGKLEREETLEHLHHVYRERASRNKRDRRVGNAKVESVKEESNTRRRGVSTGRND